MKTSSKHLKSYPFILWMALAANVLCGTSFANSDNILGTWNVIGELVTSTAENPTDPYAPKPGNIKPDTWKIEDSDSGPILTGSSGSIQGQYSLDRALFEGTYPLGSGVYMVVHIEAFLKSPSSMYGTIQNDYWGTNTVTGEMIKLGLEAWKFEASK
jgi:hypothetical protein